MSPSSRYIDSFVTEYILWRSGDQAQSNIISYDKMFRLQDESKNGLEFFYIYLQIFIRGYSNEWHVLNTLDTVSLRILGMMWVWKGSVEHGPYVVNVVPLVHVCVTGVKTALFKAYCEAILHMQPMYKSL